jgi:hypothetical protein
MYLNPKNARLRENDRQMRLDPNDHETPRHDPALAKLKPKLTISEQP